MGDSVSAIDMQFKMLDNLYENIEKDVKEMNSEIKEDVIESVGKFILSCYQLKTQVYVAHMRHENDELFTDHIEKIDELIKKGIQCHQMVVDYKEEKEKFSKEFTDAVLKYLCDAEDKPEPSKLVARYHVNKKKYYGRKLEDDDKPEPSKLVARYLNRKKKYYGIRSEDDDNTPYDHFMETMGELATVAKEAGIHRHKDFSKSEQDRERIYMTMEYKDGSKLIMYKDGSGKDEEKPLKMATIVFDDDSYEDISLPKDFDLLKKFIEKWIHSDVKTLREYLPSNWRYTM